MTHQQPVLVMRFGATRNDIVIAGHTFDRSGLTTRQKGGLRGGEFQTFRRMVVDALVAGGHVQPQPAAPRRSSSRRRRRRAH